MLKEGQPGRIFSYGLLVNESFECNIKYSQQIQLKVTGCPNWKNWKNNWILISTGCEACREYDYSLTASYIWQSMFQQSTCKNLYKKNNLNHSMAYIGELLWKLYVDWEVICINTWKLLHSVKTNNVFRATNPADIVEIFSVEVRLVFAGCPRASLVTFLL